MMRGAWVLLLALACAGVPKTLHYPETRLSNQIDDYHGTAVEDPYRWLEQLSSPETRAWVERQNALSSSYLERLPGRRALEQRLRELLNYERYTPPFREGGFYFYAKNDGLQNQSVLYRLDSFETEPQVVLNPNLLSEEGLISVRGYAVTQDGRRLAYALSEKGSDWKTWHVRNIDTGQDLADAVRWSKFSGASWSKDGQGFYYSRYPEPDPSQAYEAQNTHQELRYHRVGTSQDEDALILSDPNHPRRSFGASVSQDGAYLIIGARKGSDRRNGLYYLDLKREGAEVVRLLDRFDASYRFIGNRGSTFFIRTDLEAPRGRLIAIDLRRPSRQRWHEIISEGEDKLHQIHMLNSGFLVVWLRNAHSRVTFHGLDGELQREVPLPAIGSVSGFSGKMDDRETFYAFRSFTHPDTIYHLDLESGESRLLRQPSIEFEIESYETRQVWFESKDGTPVPMFVVHRRGLPLNGGHPTLLRGYGGFSHSLQPHFSTSVLAWLERGGVYALPNLRGGGEFGAEWHRAGMLANKQNVFDDFAAAAEWLIASGLTRPGRLAIAGGSNGGLLVGATLTQRPELVGAALCRVGVLDMLRFHKFTIGHAWTAEYGSSDDPNQFPYLYTYSPLHNIVAGRSYPAVLITAADHDDRVVPSHSYKFAAALQRAQGGTKPILLRVETGAGHGGGKPTEKRLQETADAWAFLLHALGH